jgi:hypothetical protein
MCSAESNASNYRRGNSWVTARVFIELFRMERTVAASSSNYMATQQLMNHGRNHNPCVGGSSPSSATKIIQ